MSWNKKTDAQFKEELRVKRPDVSTDDVYVNGKVKLNFKCLVCDNNWYSTPSHILNDRISCPSCSNLRKRAALVWTKEYLQEVIDSTGSGMTITGEYIDAHTKVETTCPQGHISLCLQSNLVRGSACRQCLDYGKFREAPTTLYYSKIYHSGKTYYKIGLTQRSFSRRFVGEEGRKMTLLYETVYDSPALAWEAEQSVLKTFKEFITKDKVLRKGNTEIFVSDVLHLDSHQMEEEAWH